MGIDNSKAGNFRAIKTFLLGILGVLCVIGAYAMRWDSSAELQTLDMRFRCTADSAPPENVVIIAIDDNSLGAIGRWPWPREILAGIVETLTQCGAEIVMLDIILPNPQKVRLIYPLSEIYRPDSSEIVADAPPIPIYDDAILTRAIAEAGNVFVPFHVTFNPDAQSTNSSQLESRVAELLDKNPNGSFELLMESLGKEFQNSSRKIAKIYLRQRSLMSLRRFALPVTSPAIDIPTGVPVAPLVTFAEAIYASGFVSYQSGDDGTVRQITMLTNISANSESQHRQTGEKKLHYPQLALSVAADVFVRKHGKLQGVSADNSKITLASAAGEQLVIPVNSQGKMLINWRRGEVYVSAAEVAVIIRKKAEIKRNNRLKRITQLQLAENRCPALLRLFAQADITDRKLRAARRRRYTAQLYDPANIPPAPAELLRSEAVVEKQIESAFAAFRKNDLEAFYLASVPTEPNAKTVYDKLSGMLKRIDEIEAANAEKLACIDERLEILRTKIGGKICMVGSTSTGAADIVPTPINPQTPGVVVHANILDTILTGDFIIEAPWWINALAILITGAIVAAVSVKFSVLPAAGLTLTSAAAYAAFCFLLFSLSNVWIAMVAPLAGMLVVFVIITGYRQITEERAKRQIRAMFSHAISPALVDRLMEDPSLAELGGEMRHLSCMFADLAGFTTLSERLGPQQTVRLLNSYFDRITDVVQNHRGGYINKFLGDGLMVFFGVPVFEDDHARQAVLAAVDAQRAIAEFNNGMFAAENFDTQITVRIGITTGKAMVGNCGSTQRMDYTAIGDCVNLSSRLQDANKFFRSKILIDSQTWESVKDENLLARPLGRVIVTGRTEPIWIWEIRDILDNTNSQNQQVMTDFTTAMELFAAQKFQQCRTLLESVLQRFPGDVACEVYIELCEQGIAGGEITPEISNTKGLSRIALPWE